MKTFIILLSVVILSACSSKPKDFVERPPVDSIMSQALTSDFTRQGIKIQWECRWLTGFSERTCIRGDIVSIESTAYATSNGNSQANRETAFKVAEMKAKAKLRHFIQEDVRSSIVTNTMTKNIERANDRILNNIGDTSPIIVSDTDPTNNTSVRENSNDIVRTVVENIRVSSSGILRGIYIHDQRIVDTQTVEVTVKWSRDSQRASQQFRSLMGG